MTKDAAVAGLRASHKRFMDRLAALSPERWEDVAPSGSWRVRDIAAHIAVWDRILIDDLAGIRDGLAPAWMDWDDATSNANNEEMVQDARSWSLQQLQDELVAARSALVAAVGDIDEAHFAVGPISGGAVISPEWLCQYWIRHDDEHTQNLPE
ncbi:MAG TPA: maleylpyruvate isomerase N-terminal domain-containing protein [Chloroflexota bacterium]|nr:maleylpyruvate isomerase N-terminal domain-containing protein [Chloroflexota bacterium]